MAGLKCWMSQRLVETAHQQLGGMVSGSWAMSTFYRAFGADVGKWATFRDSNIITLPEQLKVGDW